MNRAFITTVLVLGCAAAAQVGCQADPSAPAVATTDVRFVTVGDPGNEPDPETGFGAVGYEYRIGKSRITAGQYCRFLNAVARRDTYGLYNTLMWEDMKGCRIHRYGSAGDYHYRVDSDSADRPVNFISWGDAARFCNWLTNGMPTGRQDRTTTEDGSYLLNGATDDASLIAVTRQNPKDGGRYYIPTEDEWYKAAYYRGGSADAGYCEYPVLSDRLTASDGGVVAPGGAADSLRFRSEWNDMDNGSFRGLRAESFHFYNDFLYQRLRYYCIHPSKEYRVVGFRVCEVPKAAFAEGGK